MHFSALSSPSQGARNVFHTFLLTTSFILGTAALPATNSDHNHIEIAARESGFLSTSGASSLTRRAYNFNEADFECYTIDGSRYQSLVKKLETMEQKYPNAKGVPFIHASGPEWYRGDAYSKICVRKD